MSQPSDPTEAGRLQLQRALGQLPTHQPDENLWTRIAHQLAADEAVARALPQLPTHQPDEDLWARIAGQLDQPASLVAASSPAPAPARTINRMLWPAYRVAAGMAAAVLLILATWRQAPIPTSTLRETVSVGQDVLPTPAVSAAAASVADPLAQDGLRFIEAQCSAQPTVCQSADFQSLRTQLAELEAEEQRLVQAIHRLGASPDMVQHQVQVTTLKATVTRDLIQLLIS